MIKMGSLELRTDFSPIFDTFKVSKVITKRLGKKEALEEGSIENIIVALFKRVLYFNGPSDLLTSYSAGFNQLYPNENPFASICYIFN
jgi:hypothetical protein